MERGSWRLYPNDFTVLVGRPGLGKGSAINPLHNILRRANTANILSDKLTIEWILEQLSKGFPHSGVGPGGGVTFGQDTSCVFFAPELAVFLRYPETELPDLADLWDARQGVQMYGTRGKGLFKIDSPTPSMLGGCAPEWLVHAVPSNAIGGGFTRRVNFVYDSGANHKRMPWPDKADFEANTEPLVQDLRQISKTAGEYRFDNLAKPIFEQVYCDSDPNQHHDEATANYIVSRWAHVAKIGMALAASRREDRVLLKADLEEVLDEIHGVTEGLKIVFRSVGESDLTTVADKVIQYLEKVPGATYKQILNILWKDVTRDDLQVVLCTLRDGDVIEERSIGGNLCYAVLPVSTPKPKVRVAIPIN